MLVRVVALFLFLVFVAYTFMTLFRHINKTQWKTTGKVTFKLVMSALFAASFIATCGILSRLTN